MALVTFLIFGLVVGFLARALMPGRQNMGCFATALLGCAGSFMGGALGNILAGRGILTLHTGGFVGSVVGAMILLFAMRKRFR